MAVFDMHRRADGMLLLVVGSTEGGAKLRPTQVITIDPVSATRSAESEPIALPTNESFQNMAVDSEGRVFVLTISTLGGKVRVYGKEGGGSPSMSRDLPIMNVPVPSGKIGIWSMTSGRVAVDQSGHVEIAAALRFSEVVLSSLDPVPTLQPSLSTSASSLYIVPTFDSTQPLSLATITTTTTTRETSTFESTATKDLSQSFLEPSLLTTIENTATWICLATFSASSELEWGSVRKYWEKTALNSFGVDHILADSGADDQDSRTWIVGRHLTTDVFVLCVDRLGATIHPDTFATATFADETWGGRGIEASPVASGALDLNTGLLGELGKTAPALDSEGGLLLALTIKRDDRTTAVGMVRFERQSARIEDHGIAIRSFMAGEVMFLQSAGVATGGAAIAMVTSDPHTGENLHALHRVVESGRDLGFAADGVLDLGAASGAALVLASSSSEHLYAISQEMDFDGIDRLFVKDIAP